MLDDELDRFLHLLIRYLLDRLLVWLRVDAVAHVGILLCDGFFGKSLNYNIDVFFVIDNSLII